MDEATTQREAIDRQWERESRAVEPERDMPEARAGMERIAIGVESVNRQIAGLEERLHDLLGPERPAEARGVDRYVSRTTFGGHLHELADNLARTEARLADLIDRLRDGF
jgi:hypothetical protein